MTPQRDDDALQALRDFIARSGKRVLSFAGYSNAGYEDAAAMQAEAARILDAHDPARVLVNVGATASGIGAVYEIAQRKGYVTIGIVSSRAREERAPLSPAVDHVFYIRDDTWGGRLPHGDALTPTSAAVIECSDWLVAIGGGDIARDELLAARAAGKAVAFVAADMNHRIARERAQHAGLPEPVDFRGSAHAAFHTRS